MIKIQVNSIEDIQNSINKVLTENKRKKSFMAFWHPKDATFYFGAKTDKCLIREFQKEGCPAVVMFLKDRIQKQPARIAEYAQDIYKHIKIDCDNLEVLQIKSNNDGTYNINNLTTDDIGIINTALDSFLWKENWWESEGFASQREAYKWIRKAYNELKDKVLARLQDK